jgi:transcriptional regulator with XRE-family HTH domain
MPTLCEVSFQERARCRFRDALQRSRYTLQEVAYRAGVSPNTLRRWLNGESTPPPHIRARVGRVLRIPLDELIDWERETVSPLDRARIKNGYSVAELARATQMRDKTVRTLLTRPENARPIHIHSPLWTLLGTNPFQQLLETNEFQPLERIRRQRGLNYRDLARSVNAKTSLITRWCKHGIPRNTRLVETVIALCELYHVPLETLVPDPSPKLREAYRNAMTLRATTTVTAPIRSADPFDIGVRWVAIPTRTETPDE